MGQESYTEYVCDRCGARLQVKHPYRVDDDGWREIYIERANVYDGDCPRFLFCPACVPVVAGAIVAACMGKGVTVAQMEGGYTVAVAIDE